MTATTKPARVLTEEQRKQMWELFCSYGTLRWKAEAVFGSRGLGGLEESQRLRRQADEVQERFGALLWSLTE